MRASYLLDNLLNVVYIYDEYEEQYETECGKKLPAELTDLYPFLFTPLEVYVPIDKKRVFDASFYMDRMKGMYERIDYLRMFNKKRQKLENEDELTNLRRMIRIYEDKILKMLTTPINQ